METYDHVNKEYGGLKDSQISNEIVETDGKVPIFLVCSTGNLDDHDNTSRVLDVHWRLVWECKRVTDVDGERKEIEGYRIVEALLPILQTQDGGTVRSDIYHYRSSFRSFGAGSEPHWIRFPLGDLDLQDRMSLMMVAEHFQESGRVGGDCNCITCIKKTLRDAMDHGVGFVRESVEQAIAVAENYTKTALNIR